MTRPATSRAVLPSILFVVSVLLSAPAWAQLSTAELNGRVTDSSGAVLPGVTVTATQTATGLVRTAVTDENGAYLISNLPTGPYRLEVALQGFRTYVQTGIVLQVGATPTINAALELGSLEETVTVEAAAPLVDVRSAGISAVVENERILELPLDGRNPASLVLMVGAAVQLAEATNRTAPGGVRISVAGGLSTGVGYTLDGATHNNPQENVNLPLPFPDALQEFRVATSGLSAQNGFHSAASVNAVTKSGTNRFSGNGFEFLRHHRFNATSPFARIGPDGEREDDGLKRNQFGGTLGAADRGGQAVLLCCLSGHGSETAARIVHCLCAELADAGRRFHDVCLGAVQRRARGGAAGAVREQPDQSEPVQSGSAEPGEAPALLDGSMRADHI